MNLLAVSWLLLWTCLARSVDALSTSTQWNAVRRIFRDCPSTTAWNVPKNGSVCSVRRTSTSGLNVTCDEDSNVIALDFSYMLSCPFGKLTPALQRLPALQSLTLYRTGTKGQLPNQWSKLTQLTYLGIVDTEVRGTLPKRWKALNNLRELHVTGTDCCTGDLRGELPAGFYKLSNLEILDLAYMKIDSTIPPEWGGFSKLSKLDLSVNFNLTGCIPESLSHVQSLTEMRLVTTGLTGTIPAGLSALTGLKTLDLRYSAGICGAIPEGLKADVLYTPRDC